MALKRKKNLRSPKILFQTLFEDIFYESDSKDVYIPQDTYYNA